MRTTLLLFADCLRGHFSCSTEPCLAKCVLRCTLLLPSQKRDMAQSARDVVNCWEDASGNPFNVRSQDYIRTRVGVGLM